MNSKTEITAIVLAAGASSRMHGKDKLMMMIDGETLLCRAVKSICASEISKCIVVVRNDPETYQSMLVDFDVDIILAPNAHEGMSASMKTGLEAAGENANGYMICLGDMPNLTPHHFNAVIAAHQIGKITRPKTMDGLFGHPVLFDKCYHEDLKKISGDEGARALIKRESSNVVEIEMDDAILIDLDTPDAWSNWKSNSNSER